jgi:recombination protein RecT
MKQNNLVVTEKGIKDFLADSKKNLSFYYNHGNIDNFLRSAMLMIYESQQLKDCLTTRKGKISLWHSLKYAAQTGLSLNPAEGKAALIAYNGNVQYQVMKNGIIEMAMQSGQLKMLVSDTIRENDVFNIKKTMDGDQYEYIPARKDRGHIDGFFAAIKLKTGQTYIKYMTIKEIEDHRDRYSNMFRAKPEKSPWSKSFEGMALKTVIKALFRNISICPEMDQLIGIDDQNETGNIRDVTEPGFTAEEARQELEDKKIEKIKTEVKPKNKQAVNDLF